jgi:hypothetical protein
VPVELRGVLATGKTVAHARGEVILGDRATNGDRRVKVPALPTWERSTRSVYQDVLFHGPLLQGIERIDGLGEAGIDAVVKTGAPPQAWVARPLRQSWLTDPLALDGAFQLLSVWCHDRAGAASLPTRVGRYRQFRRVFPSGRVRVLATVTRPAEHRALADVEFLDADNAPVARIEGYECVIDASLNQAFRRNRLVAPRAVPSPR